MPDTTKENDSMVATDSQVNDSSGSSEEHTDAMHKGLDEPGSENKDGDESGDAAMDNIDLADSDGGEPRIGGGEEEHQTEEAGGGGDLTELRVSNTSVGMVRY
jgi:hypothetical protein